MQSTVELEQVASGKIGLLTDEDFEREFERTAFMRAGRTRLLRNMAAVQRAPQGNVPANVECGA